MNYRVRGQREMTYNLLPLQPGKSYRSMPKNPLRMHIFVNALSTQVGCNVEGMKSVARTNAPIPLCIGQIYGYHEIATEHSR
jgi:hypothetical protein